ncbi:MAG TPA: alpha-ketoglutarate-dependent dioxygenase AlkB [Vicinamibacterales bacterium]|jgi:alkylated DNA repair protein (DNA oxidative demethylase)
MLFPRHSIDEIASGAFLLAGWLTIDEQRQLVDRCRALQSAEAGMYRPTVRGGGKMRLDMLCLGRHWNALTYRYEDTRADFDGRPAPPLPDDWRALAARAAAAVGFAIDADVCIVNYYGDDGRLGLHQDKDERPETLAAGIPVVSVSLGDTARFQLGGLKRRDPIETLGLESGDVFVFGGPARLRYHGVARILPGTAPASLALSGRFNLTFRQY